MRIDRLDLQILRSLSRDGRKPFKAIARELDVSDATVRKRVRRMQKDEIIKQMAHVRDWGGKFVVPIPITTVIE